MPVADCGINSCDLNGGKRGDSLSHPGRKLFTLPNNSSFLAVAPVIRSMIPYICHAQLSYGGGVGGKKHTAPGFWLVPRIASAMVSRSIIRCSSGSPLTPIRQDSLVVEPMTRSTGYDGRANLINLIPGYLIHELVPRRN